MTVLSVLDEIVFNWGEENTRLIYLFSGILELESLEDGETALIPFSPGTVIGELSLLMYSVANYRLKARTVCQVVTLTREDFLRIMISYKKEFKDLRAKVNTNLDQAKWFYNRKEQLVDSDNAIQRVKKNYKRIISNKDSHLPKAIIVDKDYSYERLILEVTKLDRQIFVIKNMDKIALTDESQLVEDSFFVKATFPVVLQEKSLFVFGWKICVIAVTLFIAIWLPYISAFQPQSHWFNDPIESIVGLIFFIDILVQINTGNRIQGVVMGDVYTITVYRLTQTEFYFDLLAAIPFFTLYGTMAGFNNITRSEIVWFRIIRLAKLLKIEFILRKMQKELRIPHPELIEFSKNILVFVYMMYCFAALIRIEGSTHHFRINVNVYAFYKAAQWLSFIALDDDLDSYSMVMITTFFKVVSSLFYYCFLSWVIAVCVLEQNYRTQYDTLMLVEFIKEMVSNSRYDYVIPIRMSRAIAITSGNVHFQVFKQEGIHYNPTEILKTINFNIFFKLLENCKIFEYFGTEFIKTLTGQVDKIEYPAYDLIMYSGSFYQYMYLVESGCCEVWYRNDSEIIVSRAYSGDCLGALEFALRLPSFCTVVALTDVRLIPIPYPVFAKLMSEYPIESNWFHQVVNNFKIEYLASDFCNDLRYVDYNDIFTYERISMLKKTIIHGYNRYHIGTKNIWLRFFMLPITFSSQCKFIRNWERFRCLFAILTSFIIVSPLLEKTGATKPLKVILIILDLTAYVDIYIRFHIQYYLPNGITVSHPLYTSRYYLTHSFLTDIIACFPINYFNSTSFIYFLNRLLQLYRLLQYVFIFIWADPLVFPLTKYLSLSLISTIIIALLAQISLHHVCTFNSDLEATVNFTAGVFCVEESWISQSRFIKPLTPFNVYLYGLYFSTSTLSATGMSGFSIDSNVSAWFVIIFTVVGYIYSIHLYTFIVAMRRLDPSLLYYQRQVNDSILFIADRRIPSEIRKDAITFWRFAWRERQKRNPYILFQNFADTLQEDILLSIFGYSFENSSLFRQADIQFIRNLLIRMDYSICSKDKFIIRHNDIQPWFYFIVSGYVDVEDIDTEIIETLGFGSIFGNLYNHKYTKQCLTFIANTNVQLLFISAKYFYQIINSYPRFESIFWNSLKQDQDYILNTYQGEDTESTLKFNYKKKFRDQNFLHTRTGDPNFLGMKTFEMQTKQFSGILKHLPMFQNAIIPSNYFYEMWYVFFLFSICIFSFALDFYQIGIGTSYQIYFVVALIDVCYIINIYLRCHLAFANIHGDYIEDLTTITRLYLQSRDFKLDILTLIPFFLIPLFVPTKTRRAWWYLFNTLCHLNRLIRIRYIYKALDRKHHSALSTTFKTQIIYLFFAIFMLTHTLTCIRFILQCTFESKNHSSKYEQCPFGQDEFMKIYLYYHTWLMTFKVYPATLLGDYVPQSPISIIFSIILMIGREILLGTFISQCFMTYAVTLYVKQKFEIKLIHVDKFLRTQDISDVVIDSMWSYMCNFWRRSGGSNYPTLLFDSPYHIREPILVAMFGRHFTRNKIFEKLNGDFIRQLICKIEPRTYYQGVYVARVGVIDDCMYFIDKGEIELEDHNLRSVDAPNLKRNDYFGMKQGLFEQTPHVYCYRVVSDSVILSLKRQDWFYLLNYFHGVKDVIYSRISG